MHSQLQNEWRYSQGVFLFRNLEKSSFISLIYGILWKMLVYAKELLHSFHCLLFLLVFLFFLYLFVCLFFFTWEYSPTGCYVWSRDWNIFLTRLFFSHLIHTCVVSAVDLTIRVAGMLDHFFHVFVDNKSKRRWFKFWKKKLCRN